MVVYFSITIYSSTVLEPEAMHTKALIGMFLVLLDKDCIRLEDIDKVSYPLRELGWDLGEDITTVLIPLVPIE